MQHPALMKAHARNQQVVAELNALRESAGDIVDHAPELANYYPKLIASLQRIYSRLTAALDTLRYITAEGICEVTLASPTETLTWRINRQPEYSPLGDPLYEYLSDQLQEVEQKILEAKARLAGELTNGTPEEWHHANVHQLALLLEAVPQL